VGNVRNLLLAEKDEIGMKDRIGCIPTVEVVGSIDNTVDGMEVAILDGVPLDKYHCLQPDNVNDIHQNAAVPNILGGISEAGTAERKLHSSFAGRHEPVAGTSSMYVAGEESDALMVQSVSSSPRTTQHTVVGIVVRVMAVVPSIRRWQGKTLPTLE
jgi:hypothetical protein